MAVRVGAILSAIGLVLCLSGAAGAQIRIDRPIGGGDAPSGGGGPAAGGAGTVQSLDVQAVMAALKAAGYSNVELGTQKDELKFIKGEVNGSKVSVVLYCGRAGCTIVTFNAFFNASQVDLKFVNAYNLKALFTKAAIDSDGDLNFTLETQIAPGVSAGYVQTTAEIFARNMKELFEFKP